MEEMSLQNKDKDKYWENVYYIYKQLQGLYDGYKISADKENQIDFYDFIFIPSFLGAAPSKRSLLFNIYLIRVYD